MIRSLSGLCGAAVLLLAASAQAHFPWLSIDRSNPDEPVLHCYFSEGPYADDPELLKYVDTAQVKRFSGRGEPGDVKLTKAEQSLAARLDANQANSIFVLTHDLGVFNRGDATFRLMYTAATGPALSAFLWGRADTADFAGLDISPSLDQGRLQIKVTYNGKPVEAAEVILVGDDEEFAELRTDDRGRIEYDLSERAVDAIRVKYVISEPGELDGKQYPETRHFATLTFPTASYRPIATKTPYEPLPELVTSFGAAVAGDRLYVYGGHTGGAHDYYAEGQANTLRSLDLNGKDGWKELATGPGLQGLAMVAHNGKLYRIGGFTAKNPEGEDHDLWSQAEVACFDPAKNEWQPMPPLPEPRSSFDAAVLGDTIYVIGGWKMAGSEDSVWHETAWSLDLSQPEPRWQALPTAPFQRRALAVAAYRGKIYAIGGMQAKGGPTTQVAIYDPQTKTWSQGPRINGEPMTGFGSSAFALNGHLYVTAFDGTLQRLADDGSRWEVLGNLKNERFFHRMVPHQDRLILVGGANMGDGKFDQVEILTAEVLESTTGQQASTPAAGEEE